MATQQLGVDGGFSTVITGGAEDWLFYTHQRKVKTGVTTGVPGNLWSGNGETAGEIDLAADADGTASFIEIALGEVGYKERIIDGTKRIDETFDAADYVKTMRPSGGRFRVAGIRADESNNTELGEPMVTEATGHMKKWAWADSAESTDCLIEWVGRCAAVTTDVAGTDLVQEIYF